MIVKRTLWQAATEYARRHDEEAERERQGWDYGRELLRAGKVVRMENGTGQYSYALEDGTWWLVDPDTDAAAEGPYERKRDAAEAAGAMETSKLGPGLYDADGVLVARADVARASGWRGQG